jgi:PAS domain S-box-containing protein
MTSTIEHFVTDIWGKVFPPEEPVIQGSARQFVTAKQLIEKDEILIAMLNSAGHEHIPYCICDPDLKDLPIIFSSDGFCEFTGYDHSDIEGKNCRFLQGKGTKEEDVNRIRQAIKDETSCCVNLMNYRKDGTSFANEFFLAPLRSPDGKLAFVSVDD